jgi:AcrR family transcriptional regulator
MGKRISEEMLSQILRERRQGKSITAIAESLGVHRQTVRFYLKEKQDDILRDEVRKEVLAMALRDHFKELADFAGKELKEKFKASYPEGTEAFQALELSGGLVGMPAMGSPFYVANEWERIYSESSRTKHLSKALREHTADSPLWTYWDKWETNISDYKAQSLGLRVAVLLWPDAEPPEGLRIAPEYIPVLHKWLLGNLLLWAGGELGGKEVNAEIVGRSAKAHYEQLVLDGVAIRVDNGNALLSYLVDRVNELEKLPSAEPLKLATRAMKDGQSTLIDIAGKICSELDALGLKRAFSGRCHLCPV